MKETNQPKCFRDNKDRLMAIAVAGLMEAVMSDIADNPPEYFTEELVARHRKAAEVAREQRYRLMGLSEKGGAL